MYSRARKEVTLNKTTLAFRPVTCLKIKTHKEKTPSTPSEVIIIYYMCVIKYN